MENVINVAKFILSKGAYTPKQVQKILYYAYSIYLIKYNEKYSENMNKLFDEKFEAWEHGPVIRKVYFYMKQYGKSNSLMTHSKNIKLEQKENENFVDKVVAVFGRYSGSELEEMTHSEDPWKNAYNPISCDSKRCTSQITDESIFNYFHNTYIL